jgi:hypothetical protein
MDKDRLQKEIAAARWELRLASGEPLSPEEKEREDRRKALKDLSDTATTISLRSRITLKCEAVWENGPAIKIHPITVEEPKFYLRPIGDDFRFFRRLPLDGNEVLLGKFPKGDELLPSRVLVAVGDALDQEKQ